MKRIFALMLAAALLFSVAAAETKITVTGMGRTQVSADTAVISLGVSANDTDVLKAQQTVNTKMAAIRKALADHGVPEDCISTDYMNIYAVYDYSEDRERISSYSASSTLSIRVTDMDTAGELIDVSFAAGANTLNGITFSASDTEEAKNASLKAAAADARAKAEVLAEASGLKITGIETITEGGIYSYDNTVANRAMAKGAGDYEEAGTVVSAAKLVVSVTVNVTFTAE